MKPDTACNSCGVAIIFAVVSNDAGRPPRRMPLNPRPDPSGNVAVYRDETGTLRGRVLGKGGHPAPHERLYMPHFATCEAAAQRKAQRGQWTAALAQHARTGRQRRTRGWGQPRATPDRAGQLRLLPPPEESE